MRITMKTTIALMGVLSLSVACPPPVGDDGGVPEDGGEEEDGGEPVDECEIDGDCGSDEHCVDGTCELICLTEECIHDGELCQHDSASADFNQCVDPEIITGDCDSADDAAAMAGEFIVIYDVVTLLDPVADGCLVGADSFPLRSFYASVMSHVDLTAAGDAQDLVFRHGFADSAKFFEDSASSVVTEINELLDDQDQPIQYEYEVIFYICGTPAQDPVIQIHANANDVSNAYCFDAEAAAE